MGDDFSDTETQANITHMPSAMNYLTPATTYSKEAEPVLIDFDLDFDFDFDSDFEPCSPCLEEATAAPTPPCETAAIAPPSPKCVPLIQQPTTKKTQGSAASV